MFFYLLICMVDAYPHTMDSVIPSATSYSASVKSFFLLHSVLQIRYATSRLPSMSSPLTVPMRSATVSSPVYKAALHSLSMSSTSLKVLNILPF